MLGDIRGRKAGLTCDELVRFLELGAVGRLGAVALCGEAATFGDGKTALDAVRGALLGAADTLLSLADIVGVASLSTWDCVLMGCRTGLLAVVVSPVSIFSIICSISASAFDDCCLSSEILRFDFASSAASFWIRISDAGVAGESLIGAVGADWDPFARPERSGDRAVDRDRGVAGGGISASERGSGETESASELETFFAFCASLKISLTSFEDIAPLACFFLGKGFIAGECLMVRARGLAAVEAVLRFDFRVGGTLTVDFGPATSTFISTGDMVSDVSDPLTFGWTCSCAF